MASKGFPQRARDLVGDRDPMEVLSETSGRLAKMVRGAGDELMRSRPFAGKWTPNEILGHLLDHELAMAFRLRTVLFHPEPRIEGYPQEAWVTGQRHNERAPSAFLRLFDIGRGENIRLWRQVLSDGWDRTYTHDIRGEETLRLLLTMHAGHDLAHLDQMGRYLEEASGAAGRE